MRLRTKNVYR